MAVEIRMPKLSQTTNEVRIINWLVKEGDSIKKGDPLCEIENDKTTMDIESFESGIVLKLYFKPDEIVQAGTVIALLEKAHEKMEEIEERVKEKIVEVSSGGKVQGKKGTIHISKESGELAQHGTYKSTYTSSVKNVIKATSLVRNIAKKRNIDLSGVKGTGPQGLILKKDLDACKKSSINDIELSRNQIMLAHNLLKSKTEIPHYYLKCSIFTDRLLSWREKNLLQDGSKASIYSIFIYLAAMTLKDFPRINGYFKNDRVILSSSINVGFAVTARDELYVPVIRDADKKTVVEIDKEVKWLIAKAQNHRLKPEDGYGGTFTITNLGMYQVDEFCAIISPPQTGILAIGHIKKVLYIDDRDAMHIRNACTITGSFDHRCINGAQGAAFLDKFKKICEEVNS